MANIQIAVINATTVLTDDQVQAAVPALQTQVHRDFASAWGIDADLSFVPSGASPDPGLWWLTVLDNSDQAGALGYHDVTDQGFPQARCLREPTWRMATNGRSPPATSYSRCSPTRKST